MVAEVVCGKFFFHQDPYVSSNCSDFPRMNVYEFSHSYHTYSSSHHRCCYPTGKNPRIFEKYVFPSTEYTIVRQIPCSRLNLRATPYFYNLSHYALRKRHKEVEKNGEQIDSNIRRELPDEQFLMSSFCSFCIKSPMR